MFIEEQGYPLDDEIDMTEDDATYYLAFHGDSVAATGRARVSDNVTMIERVGVLKDMRGQGIGTLLVRQMLSKVTTPAEVWVQDATIPFYSNFGFIATEQTATIASMKHHQMMRGCA